MNTHGFCQCIPYKDIMEEQLNKKQFRAIKWSYIFLIIAAFIVLTSIFNSILSIYTAGPILLVIVTLFISKNKKRENTIAVILIIVSCLKALFGTTGNSFYLTLKYPFVIITLLSIAAIILNFIFSFLFYFKTTGKNPNHSVIIILTLLVLFLDIAVLYYGIPITMQLNSYSLYAVCLTYSYSIFLNLVLLYIKYKALTNEQFYQYFIVYNPRFILYKREFEKMDSKVNQNTYCVNCGSPLFLDSNFCGKCGNPVTSPKPPQIPSQP